MEYVGTGKRWEMYGKVETLKGWRGPVWSHLWVAGTEVILANVSPAQICMQETISTWLGAQVEVEVKMVESEGRDVPWGHDMDRI